jgi:hypothetical protein
MLSIVIKYIKYFSPLLVVQIPRKELSHGTLVWSVLAARRGAQVRKVSKKRKEDFLQKKTKNLKYFFVMWN